MAHVHGDRVLETSITTGTGNLTTAGAVSGYRAFTAVATANGDTFYYAIHFGTDWELGLGTRVSSPPFVFSRSLIASSTGSLINFTSASKEVWMDIPARLLQLFTPSANPNLINGTVVESHAANAVTFAVKTLAGANASVADPVFFVFAATDGTSYIRVVTAALSITIASGATMGVIAATAFRIWLAAIDNAGTVELAVQNCVDAATGDVCWFFDGGTNRITTTVQAGGGDDLALETYSAAARTNVSFIALCNFTYAALTPGTWAVSPTSINLYGPNMKKPGDVLQTVTASSVTTTASGASGAYADTTIAATIVVSSIASAVRISAFGGALGTIAASVAKVRLRNTTQGYTVGGDPAARMTVSDAGSAPLGLISAFDVPTSLSAQTYKVQIGDSSSTTNSFYSDGTAFGKILLEEIMT